MDPVSLGASVIAFLQLADRLVAVCSYIIGNIKNYPNDIRLILVETIALKSLLTTMELLSENDPDYGMWLEIYMSGTIEECKSTVNELTKLLPKTPGITAKTHKSMSSLDPILSFQKFASKVSFGKLRHSREGHVRSEPLMSPAAPTITSTQPSFMSTKSTLVVETLSWPMREPKARKLLEQLQHHKSTITLALSVDSQRDIKAVKAATDGLKLQTFPQIPRLTDVDGRKDNLHKWLITTNPSELHNKALMLHREGTGSWILGTQEWQDWVDKKSRFLWLHGIPGAGKTVLASYLYRQLPPESSVYYYCYFGHRQDETRAFLGWILSQISLKVDKITDSLLELQSKSGYGEPEDRVFLEELSSLLELTSGVYLILDAIDESLIPRDRFLTLLRTLATDERFENIQLFITSREYFDIELVLDPISVSVRMKSDSDIAIYVDEELKTNRWYAKWPQSLREEVTVVLSTKADGMFRWAVCQLDILRRLKSTDAIQNAMRKLPKTLNEIYEQILAMISEEDLYLLRRTLALISGCNVIDKTNGGLMPLHLLIYLLKEDWNGVQGPQRLEFCDADMIADICGCLVTFQAVPVKFKNDYFQEGESGCSLAHFTVQEFLSAKILKRHYNDRISYFAIDLNEARQVYSETCLEGILFHEWHKNDPGIKLRNCLSTAYRHILSEIAASSTDITNCVWAGNSTRIKKAMFQIMNPGGAVYKLIYQPEGYKEHELLVTDVFIFLGIPTSFIKEQAGLFCQMLIAQCYSWAVEILKPDNKNIILTKTNFTAKIKFRTRHAIQFNGKVIEFFYIINYFFRRSEAWPEFKEFLERYGVDTTGIDFNCHLKDGEIIKDKIRRAKYYREGSFSY